MMGDSSGSGMGGRLCVFPGAWRVEAKADCCLVSGFPYVGFVVVVSSSRVVVVVVDCIQGESGPLQRLNGKSGNQGECTCCSE